MAKINETVRLAISGVRVTAAGDRDRGEVEVKGGLEFLDRCTPEDAARLAAALLKGAAKASAPPGVTCDPNCVHCLVSQLLQACQPLELPQDAAALGQVVADIVASVAPADRCNTAFLIERESMAMLRQAVAGTWRDGKVE